MADKDEFDFWEPQDQEENQQEEGATVEQELRQELGEAEKSKPGGARPLILLLTLLLVLAGAAFFYLGGSQPESEAPAPSPPVRQPIALPPPPPAEEAAGKSEPAETPKTDVGAPEAPVADAAPVEKTPAPAVKAEPAAAPPVAAAPAKEGAFYLQAGAFLVKDNLRAAEATVRRLGYEPQVEVVRRTMPMTRLRVGGFFAEEGETKLKSLKTLAPSAFLIRQGEYVLVYAGSYQDIDRARRAADYLYQHGIRVEEEPATAEVPLSLLSFGKFPDRSAAEQAAVRARAAGLEAVVRKDP